MQGSYGNDTNVRGDSDVDVVIYTKDTYHYDIDHLPADQKQRYQQENKDVPSAGPSFKQEVIAWLNKQYGAANVIPGNKAILLKGNSYRRDADILIATEHRQYYSYNGDPKVGHHKGVRFFAANGTSIVNFPKLHGRACTDKHQATNDQFKPTIRIFKNMRNRMIEKGIIHRTALAPSYYIEGCSVERAERHVLLLTTMPRLPGMPQLARKARTGETLLTANQRRFISRRSTGCVGAS